MSIEKDIANLMSKHGKVVQRKSTSKKAEFQEDRPSISERRNLARRTKKDRRDMIRFEVDRRHSKGRRKDEKIWQDVGLET